MVILGIDPGTASTGYGLIKIKEKKQKAIEYLACDVIHTSPKSNKGERLKKINQELSKIIKEYQPQVLVFEKLFFFRNFKTAIPVSQAQGVVILTAAKKNLPIYEFTPLEVKLTITGSGKADKKEVQKKLKKLLNLKTIPKEDDAADALAVALTYFLKVC